MSAEIVNLRRVRKAKQRAAKADTADANRLAFGTSKAERDLAKARTALAERQIEGHRRERPSPEADRAAAGPGLEDGRDGQ